MSTSSVGIYGSGGFAREVAWLVESSPIHVASKVVAFIDDLQNNVINEFGIPVMDTGSYVREHSSPIVIAIGSPEVRKRVAAECELAGLTFTSLVHDSVAVSRFVSVGVGSVICVGSTLTTAIQIGQHVHINPNCTIGHDVQIGAFVTLSPGAHVSGNVIIEDGAFIGAGAVILNGAPGAPMTIGRDAVVGGGAVVTQPVGPETTVVGVPAKPLGERRTENSSVRRT